MAQPLMIIQEGGNGMVEFTQMEITLLFFLVFIGGMFFDSVVRTIIGL